MAEKKSIESSMSEEDKRKKRESFLKQLTTSEDAEFLERVSKVPGPISDPAALKSLRDPRKFNPTLASGAPTDIANNLFETSLKDIVRGTTYGSEIDNELLKAEVYAKTQGLPVGLIDKRFNVAINPGRRNFAMPGKNLVSIDPKERANENNKEVDASNGFRRLRENKEALGYHPAGFDRFEDTDTPTKLAFSELVEHEGGHQGYSGLDKQILPQTTTLGSPQATPVWTESPQLYANNPGEMANFLMAVQRDRYTTTGSRFEKPEDFEKDMLEIMSSADPEKAMDDKGYNRADARRGIRSIIASSKLRRRQIIKNMSKVVPSLAKNEEFSGGLLS